MGGYGTVIPLYPNGKDVKFEITQLNPTVTLNIGFAMSDSVHQFQVKHFEKGVLKEGDVVTFEMKYQESRLHTVDLIVTHPAADGRRPHTFTIFSYGQMRRGMSVRDWEKYEQDHWVFYFGCFGWT